jgi:hypothetical protein
MRICVRLKWCASSMTSGAGLGQGFCFAKTTLTSGEVADISVASSGAGRRINGFDARGWRCTVVEALRTACKIVEVSLPRN